MLDLSCMEMTTAAANMAVATTILEQLGGKRFVAMTGAKNFLAVDSGLRFRVPTSRGINCVSITLEPSDTYRLTAYRVRGTTVTKVATRDGVYCDVLAEVFTRVTGLYTRL